MPLVKSGSREAISANIRSETAAGKPRKQAVAIALDVARRAKRAVGGRAEGGPVALLAATDRDRDDHGDTARNRGLSVLREDMASPFASIYQRSDANKAQAIADAVPRRAQGGGLGAATMAPWFVRNEARSLNGSSGLHSAVPGRTDHLPLTVRSGSYVMPADIVSGMGQGNTNAGMQVLNHMFFQSGPYGGGLPRGHGGMGIPRPPKATKLASGGAPPGDGEVPIMAAGGEFVLDPDKVAEIGNGDVNLGHDVLDEFVNSYRADMIKELKKLPGPSKS